MSSCFRKHVFSFVFLESSSLTRVKQAVITCFKRIAESWSSLGECLKPVFEETECGFVCLPTVTPGSGRKLGLHVQSL